MLKLTAMPSPEMSRSVLVFKELDKLYISRNGLRSLPPCLAEHLPKLRCLILDDNQFTKIPPAVFQLKALRRLSLVRNQIMELPTDWGCLNESLERLYLEENPVFDAFLEKRKAKEGARMAEKEESSRSAFYTMLKQTTRLKNLQR